MMYQATSFLSMTVEDYITSTLWISVSMGFRSPPSGRMAVWLWFRCVFGPQLQRIHRPPEQPLTEGRTGRRVWLFTILYLLPKDDRMWKCDSIASLGVGVAPARFRKCQVCCWYPAANIEAAAKWMNERTLRQSYVCLSMATGFFPPHSSTNSCMTCFL